MTGTRWLAVASALIGTFLVSVAAGALIARQLNPGPAIPPVAVASPSPGPAATPTPAPAAPTPTTPLAPTPGTDTPTPVSPTATPIEALDPATAEQFATDLSAAIRAGDTAYLVARVHPITVDRYGAQQCRRYVRQAVSGDQVTWEIQGSTGPASWDYTTDGLTTAVSDAWAVSVRQPGADPELRDAHFAPSDGTWRWFTDCGDPT